METNVKHHVYYVAVLFAMCVFYLFIFIYSGTGMLKIDFVGELNDKMKGFYRSKYNTASGEVRYAAVTQFEVRTQGSGD